MLYNIKNMDNIPELILHGNVDSQMAEYVVNALKYYEGESEKKVRMRLLSMGGLVSQGMAILSAMQNFIAKGGEIETINEGMCYSTMGWIYSMGSTRKAWDYSTLLVHNAHTPTGEDSETLEKINNSIVLMLTNSTGINEDDMRQAMCRETTYSAEESKEYGFTDEVLISDRQPVLVGNSVEEVYNSLTNFHKKVEKMKQVAEALNLAPEASVEAQVKVIEAKNSKIEALSEAVENYKLEQAEKDEKINGLEAQIKEYQEKEVENFVGSLIEKGTINAEKKENVLNMIQEKGFENVKAVYDSLDGLGIKKAANISNEIKETPSATKDQDLALKYDQIKDNERALNETDKEVLAAMELAYAENIDYVQDFNNKKK